MDAAGTQANSLEFHGATINHVSEFATETTELATMHGSLRMCAWTRTNLYVTVSTVY